MKTFKLNIPKELRNWSNALDAKTVLCSRSWVTFNDEGVKEVYIFQEDGTLIVSKNGKVAKTRWEYIAQNTSLIIENIDSALGQFFGEVDFLHLKRIDFFDFLQHAIGYIT